MKTLLLMAVVLLMVGAAVRGQSRFPVQQELLGKLQKKKNFDFPFHGLPDVKGTLAVPFNSTALPEPNFKSFPYRLEGTAPVKVKKRLGMPVMKPQGRYPMPVVSPDSTIQFTLLIKNYPPLQD